MLLCDGYMDWFDFVVELCFEVVVFVIDGECVVFVCEL